MNTAILLRIWPIIILLTGFLLPFTIFNVDETNQVIITRLGEYKRTLQEPGLKLKIPIFEQAHFFEKNNCN